jgi:hypothetical protein
MGIANHPPLRIQPMLPIGTGHQLICPLRLLGAQHGFKPGFIRVSDARKIAHL